MNKMRLGRKIYTLHRDDGNNKLGDYVDGEWVSTPTLRSVAFRATIQPASASNLMRMGIAGEREQEAIFISSNIQLFMSRSQTQDDNRNADIIDYAGAKWEVRKSITYNNLNNLAHCEAIAMRMNDSVRERLEGDISCS